MKILLATDFSECADAALRVATDYARRLGAGLHVFHVFAPGSIDVARVLAGIAEQAAGVSVDVAATGGDPAEEILRYAKGHSIDLIVMGTHGRSGVSRLLLGNVVDQVMRGAVCPVLVVPLVQASTVPRKRPPPVERASAERHP